MEGNEKLFLHATWIPEKEHEGSMFFWAESASAANQIKDNKRMHPFCVDSAKICSVLKGARASKLVLNLPSATGRPLPSPEASVFIEVKGGNKKAGMREWAVSGAVLEPSSVVGLMSGIGGNGTIVLCNDFKYWQEASKFVLRLLARHKFFPAMAKCGEREYCPVWNLVIEEADDVKIFEALSSSIPGLQKPSLGHFLNAVADASIREWASEYHEPETEETPSVEKWFALLTGAKKFMQPFNRDVENIFGSFERWSEPLNVSTGGTPFRTLFQLEPPAEGSSQAWVLNFFLQDTSDHSLMVASGEVWKEGGGKAIKFLNKKFLNPQERLLSDLGRASKIFSPIEKGLHEQRPSNCALSIEEAYSFLSEHSWLLKESGFGVLLPSWWEEKGKSENRLGVKLRLKSEDSGLFNLQSLADFDWELAIGKETLSREEFEHLAALKVPLVNVRGKWVVIRKEHVKEALKRLRQMKNSGVLVADVLKWSFGLQANSGSEEGVLPVNGIEASGQLADLISSLEDFEKIRQINHPKKFKGALRHYQLKGVSWLAFLKKFGFGACLADDMGLGKTIQLIALLLSMEEEGNPVKPTLLMCPTSVIGNWSRELERFSPSIKVMVHHGHDRSGFKQFVKEAATKDLVITSYGLSHREEQAFSALNWACIVLDEAQNIKNPFTKQASSIKRLKAGFRVALTGTPVENRLSELWSIFDFLNPSYLGGYESFRRNFAIPVERYNDKEAAERLRSVVRPFVLRRLKTDKSIISDLPEKTETKVFCNLTREQATLYEAVVKSSLNEIEASEGMKRKGNILAAITKLKQVCNHPSLFMHDKGSPGQRSGKLERLKEMLEEVLSEGYSALIFTQFSEMGHMLKSYLQSAFNQEVLFLYGQTPRKARDEMVRRFQNNGAKLFVLSIKAGGFGLNLTSASNVFHFDRWWNPAVENQATDRAFRIGQTKNVQVYKFITQGTVEEKIDALIERKKQLAGNIIGSGESWLTEMSTDQLREIFSLREGLIFSDD